MAQDPDRLQELAERYTEAWCSQNPERVAAHYAPGGSLTINAGAPSIGRAAIAEAARSFMVAFPDMEVLMDGLRIQDDSADTTGRSSGRTRDPAGPARQFGSTASKSGRSARTA